MKYIVVEVHTGYAVLMDENALFVRSANLSYEVGQTVENPVLEEIPEKQGKNIIIYRVLASAAACIAIVTGFFAYQRNYAVYSTITISASAGEICLQVNRKGEVLTAESMDNESSQIIEDYHAKGKDKITAAEEIVQKAVSMGCINDGQTVSFYIDSPENDYMEYKAEFEEHFRSDRKIKVNVKKDNHLREHKKPEKTVTTDTAVTKPTEQSEIYQEITPSENVNQKNSIVAENIPRQPETESDENFSDSDKSSIENSENFYNSDKNNENYNDFPEKNGTRNNHNENYDNDNNFYDFNNDTYENYDNFYDYDENNYQENQNHDFSSEYQNNSRQHGGHSR